MKFSKDQGFAISLGLFQLLCLVIFGTHFDTISSTYISVSNSTRRLEESGKPTEELAPRLQKVYPMYMDVHVMIFIGFGFLMTYLRKYSLSAVSLNFIVGAMAAQWGLICVTMAHQIGDGHYPKALIDVPGLVNGDFAAGAVLISFGAVLGKTTPTQLLWMTFYEVIFYAINEYILIEKLHVIDAGGSMVIHTFGAFFGLAVTMALGAPSQADQEHNTSRYTSDIFSMVGTIFLWMYWPSFNGALVPSDGFRQERAVINTLLSISGSCAAAFVCTQLMSKHKKFDMVHLQNSTLAGGVAMGATCELAINPGCAIVVGVVAGVVSVAGYAFILPFLEERINLSDSAGILNLHGMPGVIGGLACGFATMALSDHHYGEWLTEIYSARDHRTAGQQGGYQILATVVTMAIAIFSGAAVGIILRTPALFYQQSMKYDDEEWFHVPQDTLFHMPLSNSPPACVEMHDRSHNLSPDINAEYTGLKTNV
ncbi:TPA: hypothetical protein N0F65_002860 [Lagenidium giganteum]|uniref:Ammonium transporter AmtB-like domain-containing protein n=1 Tax=Lagenidium giganteum TaxID=4803 RepID=A0AAV2ZD15_9STRA|nr:TPA: hypothetical protein N0F65_002860 [Lagenidium giganteum]